MADRPIVKIPVDSSEWDAFVDSFMRYQKVLDTQDDSWKKTNKAIAAADGAFARMEKTWGKLVKTTLDPKLTSQSSGAFSRVKKDAQETSKFWLNTRREIEKSDKALQGMVRGGLSLGKVFGVFGSAGLLMGGIFGGTLAAAGSVASDFKSSRQLGLQLGKEKEFGIAGEPYGLGRDQLDEAANAKADPTRQLPFMNAGISPSDIATMDAAELAWRKAEGEARLFSQWQKTSPQFAVAQAQSFFPGENPDQLRLLADALDKGDLGKAHDSYEANWKAVGYSQQQGEAATQFTQDQAQKWAAVEAAFNKDVLLLAPHLDRWATAAENLAIHFLDVTAKTVDDLADAGDSPTPPGTAPAHAAPGDYPGRVREGAQIAGQWLTAHGLKNPFDDAGTDSQSTSMSNALDAIRMIESSGNPNAVNKKTGAAGAYGLLPSTAAQYGVDPFNEQQSRAAASELLAHDLQRFGDMKKALAAYDWGEGHLAKDIAVHGADWEKYLPDETEAYLVKARELYGVDLDTTSKEALAAFNDPKMVAASLDDGEQQIDVSKGKPGAAAAGAPAAGASARSDLDDFTARLRTALQPVRDLFSEGGGSQFAQTPRPAATSPQQFNATVTVNAPPGHDVNVSATQLAQ